MDILIFGGQSNMQGQTESLPEPNEPVENALEYRFEADAGIQRFAMIRVGYFCATVRWLTDRTKEDSKACDEAIMQAQQALAETDADFVLLTDICGKLSLEPRYINPFADGHYNNAAMTVIGTEAGNALAKL